MSQDAKLLQVENHLPKESRNGQVNLASPDIREQEHPNDINADRNPPDTIWKGSQWKDTNEHTSLQLTD